MSTPRDDRATDLHPTDLGVPADPSTPADESVTHPPVLPDTTDPAPVPTQPPASHVKLKPTRISGTWVAVIIAIFVLIFLLVFILQNLAGVTIHFLGGAFTLPLGVALLFAAIGGALLVALVGAARIMQLRRQTKRALR
ncbi:lipopolysaccharide assembly protein LapA domain-containing protein [Umezawaea tangerina]|uniref:LapA family protein n=1 Tax=Umezawaea tangerina TaxID=84725 RepID=UPI003CCB9B4A